MVRTEKLGMVFITGFKRKKVTALKDLTMEVKKGEVFGFLGPNGAGKTTTLKILMGLIYQTSGKAPVALGDLIHSGLIEFVPQDPAGGSFVIGPDGKVRSTAIKEKIGVYTK